MNLAIYMEGGGDGKNTKSALREGMEVFLAEIKNACRARNWHWKLVPCGSRNEARRRFQTPVRTVTLESSYFWSIQKRRSPWSPSII